MQERSTFTFDLSMGDEMGAHVTCLQYVTRGMTRQDPTKGKHVAMAKQSHLLSPCRYIQLPGLILVLVKCSTYVS